MSMANGQVKKSKLQQFVPAGDGQEGELMAFIGSLIDQNAELAGKLENIDSLTELAEKTVIEAGKEAEIIRAEAEREAKARAAAIVAGAVDKAKAAAQKVVAKAKEKAEAEARRIIDEARQRAEESVQERLSLAEQQAQEMIKAAEEKGSRIIAEAREKAEQETSKKLGGRPRVRDPFDVPDELLWEPVAARETKATPMEEGKSPESPVAEPAVAEARQASAENSAEQPSFSKEEEERPASYDDTVELTLLPPVALDRMLKLHKHLKKDSRVKVVGLGGSLDKGVTIKLLVQSHTPLISMLAALPEVEKVSDEPIEAGKISSAHRKGDGAHPRTIEITMKR